MAAIVLAVHSAAAWSLSWRTCPQPRLAVDVGMARGCAACLQDRDLPSDDLGFSTFTESSSLLTQFHLGVARQRAGDTNGALEAYDVFVRAAEEHGAPPHTFSEVLVNMGILYVQRRDRSAARKSFERALECRPLSAAHVNLALLCLAEGSAAAAAEGLQSSMPVSAVLAAKEHCLKAIALNNDERSVATAERLLQEMAQRQA
jgi:tetratricopeptide (TPR) repeat protein